MLDRRYDYKYVLLNFRGMFRLIFEFILGDLNLHKVQSVWNFPFVDYKCNLNSIAKP